MFDFEKLEVYQITKALVSDALRIIATNEKLDPYVRDQWKRLSMDILLNLAEGTGKMVVSEKKHYITMARSAVFSSVAILQIVGEAGTVPMTQAQDLYDRYEKVSKMLLGMYRSHTE